MKKELAVFLLACVSVLCFSCNNAVIPNGPLMTDEYRLEDPFCIVEMRDNININLKKSNQTHQGGTIYVEAGENIIDNIRTNVHGDTLTIYNDNSFNYLRPYNNAVEMTVYFDSLYKIVFCSNGTLNTLDTIKGIHIPLQDTINYSDTIIGPSGDTVIQLNDSITDKTLSTFEIQIHGGSGTANILTQCQRLVTDYHAGTACIYGKGYAGYAQTYGTHNSHGIIDYSALETNLHSITYFGTNRIYIKVLHEIIANNYINGEIHFMKYVTSNEEYEWNDNLHQMDTILVNKLHPEYLHYNGNYIAVWRYNDSIPGLIGHRIY